MRGGCGDPPGRGRPDCASHGGGGAAALQLRAGGGGTGGGSGGVSSGAGPAGRRLSPSEREAAGTSDGPRAGEGTWASEVGARGPPPRLRAPGKFSDRCRGGNPSRGRAASGEPKPGPRWRGANSPGVGPGGGEDAAAARGRTERVGTAGPPETHCRAPVGQGPEPLCFVSPSLGRRLAPFLRGRGTQVRRPPVPQGSTSRASSDLARPCLGKGCAGPGRGAGGGEGGSKRARASLGRLLASAREIGNAPMGRSCPPS